MRKDIRRSEFKDSQNRFCQSRERKKESQEPKKAGLFCGLFDFLNRYTVKDFCPECIEEIKGFIQKGAFESENSPDKH